MNQDGREAARARQDLINIPGSRRSRFICVYALINLEHSGGKFSNEI